MVEAENIEKITYEKMIEELTEMDKNHESNTNTYRGITWNNAADLSKKLGKVQSYVAKYIRDGRSYEEIIDHVLDGKTFQND